MNPLDDDAFMNAPPPAVNEEVVEESTTVVEPAVNETSIEETPVVVVETPTETEVEVVETPSQEVTVETVKEDNTESEKPVADDDLKPPVEKQEVDDKPVVDKPAAEKAVVVDYEARYKEALAPLKANGKTVELQSMEELRQLASMGANFTRKMQDIAPHRKILAMLENNGMLDEAKLSFYIDIDKKNPEALKKLIKDSGVDPLDIDVSVEPAYQAGNHAVSDNEIAFRTVLEDLQSSPSGKETISVINSEWDQASKDELWKSPEVMATIQQQRENGVYSKIATEINRQTTLGTIPAGTPFIQAYLAVGSELNSRGAFKNIVAPNNHVVQNTQTQTASQVPVPVATRVVTPKSQVTNSAAANAAASTRQTQKRVVPVTNLDNLSDDDFLKNWQNRL